VVEVEPVCGAQELLIRTLGGSIDFSFRLVGRTQARGGGHGARQQVVVRKATLVQLVLQAETTRSSFMKSTAKVIVGAAALIASLASGSAFAMGDGVLVKDWSKFESTWGSDHFKRGTAGTWCADRAGCTTVSGNKVAFCHMVVKNQSGQWVQGQRFNKAWTTPNSRSRLKNC
jgi:hypothetical protein